MWDKKILQIPISSPCLQNESKQFQWEMTRFWFNYYTSDEDKILEQVKLQNNAQEDIAGKILKLK